MSFVFTCLYKVFLYSELLLISTLLHKIKKGTNRRFHKSYDVKCIVFLGNFAKMAAPVALQNENIAIISNFSGNYEKDY